MEIIIIPIAVVGLALGAGSFVLKNLYYICQPSEVLIFAGSRRRLANRQSIGYRLVKGGSSLRTPLLERAFRMDLTNMIIELRVVNAYSKGGIPLRVDGVANIKIAGSEPTIHNAIERLLGKSRKEIQQIAKETLEGNLRGVLATLTPEQVNEDKIAFAKSLLDEAEDDLERLGLVLDTLQIQNISDDVRYLDSIGRKQQAELQRDARIAEAEAKAASAKKSADNERITSLRRIDSEIEIARAEAERRIQDALTKRGALVAEAEAEIASEVVRTQADVSVQTERIKQVEQQLQADVVAPAEAESKRAIAKAKGDAAEIVEDGKAQAAGVRELAASWLNAGPNAREIFLYQKLEPLLKTMVTTVPELDIQNVTVIDTKNGGTVAKLASFLEQLRQTSGMDVAGAVNRLASTNGQSADSATLPQIETSPVTDRKPAANAAEADEAWLSKFPGSEPDENPWSSLRSDVQQFLDRLSQRNVTSYQAEQAVKQAIQRYPNFKQRLQRALQAGGDETIRQIFAHPLIRISSRTIDAWLEEE